MSRGGVWWAARGLTWHLPGSPCLPRGPSWGGGLLDPGASSLASAAPAQAALLQDGRNLGASARWEEAEGF